MRGKEIREGQGGVKQMDEGKEGWRVRKREKEVKGISIFLNPCY